MASSNMCRILSTLYCVIALVMAKPAYSEIRLFDTQSFYDHMLDKENSGIGLVPIRLMDNKTLITAAAMRRDEVMPAEIRVVNAMWLLDGHNGADRNLAKQMLRDDLEALLNRVTNDSENDANNSKQQGLNKPRAAIFNEKNYRIRFSGDRILLRFNYGF